MREPLRDRNRLEHIEEAIDTILKRTDGMTFDGFVSDKILFGGIVYYTMVIGEAVYNLSSAFKESHPSVEWDSIAKMRHHLVHGYYQVDADVVWSVIKRDLPSLQMQISRFLSDTDWHEWESRELLKQETLVHKSLMQTASRMKARGYDVNEICKITGLSREEIEEIDA